MKSRERDEQVSKLFLSACDLPTEQRAAYLRRECGGDSELRAEVEALLTRELDDSGLLDSQKLKAGADALGLGATTQRPPVESPHQKRPERIGPYSIREVLGEGGMGIVYLAEQENPRRKVALKVIKPGMDSRAVIARFEAERQALALMDHANVARVYDAGTTELGHPYFVMEHVAGVPITEHCDRHKLSIDQRLDLFMQVCAAVQHAHQKGIIHRDIKPSNILVEYANGKSVPKVIDFGVAKATNQRLTEKTVFTEQGQLIGTPEYMSPEQAEMTSQDIDTRTDIYSLGVLLYELLTGTLPFDPRSLRSAGFAAIQRIIREVEPPKPSTRLSALSADDRVDEPRAPATGQSEPEALARVPAADGRKSLARASGSVADIADRRRSDPRTLLKNLRGDLDWIVMKCLEKDRTRRYDTANALAMEIRRHLNSEPVLAGPAGAGYRLAKFVRRNRAGVATAGVLAAVLVAATAVSIGFALSEAEQRRVAQAAEAEQNRARQEAERQSRIAKAVNEFLNKDLLAAVAPSAESGQGKDVLMRDVLDEAAERIEQASSVGGRFEELPLVEASIRATLGETYYLLGEYAAAEPHLERAFLLRRRELDDEHPSTLSSTDNLASLYDVQGRYDEAEPLFVRTLEIRKRVLGEEHPSTLGSMNSLAILYWRQARYDEAEPLYLKTLEIQKRVLGEEHPSTLGSMFNLALLYRDQGRYDKAEPLYAKTLAVRKRVLGKEHPNTLSSMNSLASLYQGQGRYDEAEPLFAKMLQIMKRVLGNEHPHTLLSVNNLASLYLVQGRYDEAEPLFAKTLEIQNRVLGEEHPDTLGSMHNLAFLYSDQGRYDEAERLYVKTLEIRKRVLGEEHPETLKSRNNLAFLYWRQGRYDEAEPLYVKTLEIQKRVLGEEHPDALASINNLANLYRDQGRYDEAEPLYVKTLEIRERVLGEEHPSTLASMSDLALLYQDRRRYDEAELLGVKTLEIQKRVLGEEHPETLKSMNSLATLFVNQGRTDDAWPLIRALQEAKRRRAERPGASANEKNELAWNLLTCEPADLRDPETALRLARDACAMTNNANHAYLDTLALAQHLTGDTPAAIETEKKALALLAPDAPGRGEYEAALARFETALKEARAAEEPDGG